MKKSVKTISLFLGISIFAFGVLKFINPFKKWYTIQVATSELPFPEFSYWAGQLGEILSGLILILLALFNQKIANKVNKISFNISHITIAFMMIVAFYVHLHANVPSEVLPLQIKTPYIPIFFLTLSILNIWLNKRKPLHTHG